MPGHRADRVAEDIRREIVAVMKEIKDPRVAERFLTVVRVNVSGDLSSAKIFVSSLKNIEEAEEAVKVLNKASGFIRHEVGHNLRLRKAPELLFVADDSIEHGMEIVKKLDSIAGGNNEN